MVQEDRVGERRRKNGDTETKVAVDGPHGEDCKGLITGRERRKTSLLTCSKMSSEGSRLSYSFGSEGK